MSSVILYYTKINYRDNFQYKKLRLKKIGFPSKMTDALGDVQLHEPSAIDCQIISL